jgi:hypothetical protein
MDCAQTLKQSPVMLLALGQSSAGNHGQQPVAGLLPVAVFHGGSIEEPFARRHGRRWQPVVAFGGAMARGDAASTCCFGCAGS